MKVSSKGLAVIKECEGCSLTAYQDSVGVWTIGYGHTSAAGDPAVRRGLKITQHEAETILARDLVKYEQAVMDCLEHTPTQPQFDAMVSLCYNIGPASFGKSSVVRYYNGGNLLAAAGAFRLFRKAGGKVLPGLIARREKERTLFLSVPETRPVEPQKPPVAPDKSKAGQDAGAAGAAAGGASLAHYLDVSLEIIAGMLILAAIAYVAWRIYGGRK